MRRWNQIAALLRDPRRGAELGVAGGRFTAHLLGQFPELHMLAVDLWAPRPRLDRVGFESYEEWDFTRLRREFRERTAPYADRVTVIEKDTRAAALDVPDGSLDFVFIDAEHTYEAVLADVIAWRPKIIAGGLVCGHDFSARFPGVMRAVNESFPNVTVGLDWCWWARVN